MKRVDIVAFGTPEEVARCVDVPDLPPPSAGHVLFDVLAFPINPADISFCTGRYRLRPPLPATPGAECVGRVSAVGSGVTRVRPGDLVINLQRENWAQCRLVAEADVLPLPPGIDLRQAAMIRINPPTASLMLSDIVDLAAGDWIIQNVANSAVGRLVIALAQRRGLRSINVARRADVFDELTSLGADVCLLDGDDLAGRVTDATQGARVRLGLDAISGEATARIAACVADGGSICNYGSLSGEDCRIRTADTVFRGVTLTGFMLGRFLARRSAVEVQAIYTDIAEGVMSGAVYAAVGAVYGIEAIGDALRHAQRPGRDGKILVAPNELV
jgi:NADPH:quinone reductase-like Zn-dependent oxidoreductase